MMKTRHEPSASLKMFASVPDEQLSAFHQRYLRLRDMVLSTGRNLTADEDIDLYLRAVTPLELVELKMEVIQHKAKRREERETCSTIDNFDNQVPSLSTMFLTLPNLPTLVPRISPLPMLPTSFPSSNPLATPSRRGVTDS
jgi:hypothetical protein